MTIDASQAAAFRAASRKLEDAERAVSALSWLKEYGPKDEGVGRDRINAAVNMNYAYACAGAAEAKVYLEEAVQFYMLDICRYAIALAEKQRAVGEEMIKGTALLPPQQPT